ncbi:MAG TPA: hypothetical protein VMZ92_09815, partial [Planctomycetota bacterium]|nr:hypothetical protein [Planctomycetota bacterium]
MRTPRIIERTAVLIVCVLAASSAFACGPWFTKVLSSTSDEELLVGPVAVFEEELRRIDPPV